MTKFFEPIDVSATHIYHSALELCPTSSIVRKLYYDRCHGIARFPRVVIGNPDSWDQTTSFSGEGIYEHFIWSPCGRFVAAQTEAIVEIRNQLTFQLLTVLQPPKNDSLLTGPLAYSPDGRSLACGFSDGIVIWDIQTGGVAQSINCVSGMLSLVWSLDGRTIASVLPFLDNCSGVETYGVSSSAQLFKRKLQMEWVFHLWACETSFRFISKWLSPSDPEPRFSISEIGSTRVKIERLPVVTRPPVTIVFSPSAYRISLSDPDTLRILDVRDLQSLLHEKNSRSFSCFSSDGSLFAAPHKNGFRVWQYTSGSYVFLKEYLLPHLPSFSPDKFFLQFSPTSTSILSLCENILQVWRLHGPSTTPKTSRQLATISHSGRYIATAHKFQNTVTIINLHSQAPSQFIDTGEGIEGLAVTGNVLLVAFSEKVVGWLLTEEGIVVGVADNRRATLSDSLWTVTSPLQRPKPLYFRVSGQAGMIGTNNVFPFTYHTGTGGSPDRADALASFVFYWISIYEPSDYQEYHYLRHNGTPPKDSWLTSRTATGKAAWVVDPEGRHRFWVPVEWRAPWDPKNCHYDITTLFTRIGDQPVIIKF